LKPTAVHLPLEEARRLVSGAIVGSPAHGGPAAEEADLFRARGRVLAGPVLAPENVPAFCRSTVDGYAVTAADTFGASEGAPALLELAGRVPAGRPADIRLGPGSCAAVATGAMLPEGADAVVMVEHTGEAGADLVEVRRPVAPGENVVRPGEDVAAGSEVLRAGRRLTSFDLGLLAALGLTRVVVRPRPRVAVLPTGDEVVPPEAGPLAPGQVRDCVSAPLAGLVSSDGGDPVVGAVVPDDPTALLAALERACAEADLVFLVGGSSVGARDHTADVLDRLGPPGVLLHGLALKPGKPTVFGVCGPRRVPVFGLPGHPVSALVVYRVLGRLAVRLAGGEEPGAVRPWPPEPTLRARLAEAVPSDQGREEYVCVALQSEHDGSDRPVRRGPAGAPAAGQSGGHLPLAVPVPGKSGLVSTLSRADGLVRLPVGCRGLEAGTVVEVTLLD